MPRFDSSQHLVGFYYTHNCIMNFLLKFKGENREEPLRSPRDITVEQRAANKKAAANG